jgi:dienelactone hydrolase
VLTRLLVAALAVTAYGQELPKGQIVDDVKCAADPSQSYVLYLPSNYTPSRSWNLVLGFDAGGRGRRPVERFQSAAEKYGYIVVGSNNSRNGPWEISMNAAKAMLNDAVKRFSINGKRIYATGQSGGARVAMRVAMDSGQIAGVLASSAVYPGDELLKTVPFPVFGTAGTEDFNYQELRAFDRLLTSPHRVRNFEGGHTWMSSELATEGIEWMEIQAMKSGLRPKDEALLKKIFAARSAQVSIEKGDASTYLALNSLVADFQGLADVSKFAARASALEHQETVKAAMKKELAADEQEVQQSEDLSSLENKYFEESDASAAAFAQLKATLLGLKRQSDAPQDSADRRRARRLIGGIVTGSGRIEDPEFRKLLDQIRLPQQPF